MWNPCQPTNASNLCPHPPPPHHPNGTLTEPLWGPLPPLSDLGNIFALCAQCVHIAVKNPHRGLGVWVEGTPFNWRKWAMGESWSSAMGAHCGGPSLGKAPAPGPSQTAPIGHKPTHLVSDGRV